MQPHACRRTAEGASGRASMHPWTLLWTKNEGHPTAPRDGADRVARVAGEYLRAGAAGLPCADLAVALAEAVLDEATVQLALRVLEVGPFAHARATELAERVLRDTARPSGARRAHRVDGV
jgi:hypothetical protein